MVIAGIRILAVACLVSMISGCLASAPRIAEGSVAPADLIREWSWKTPEGLSGVYVARLLVYPTSDDLNFTIEGRLNTPNHDGEFLYAEAAWENASGAARYYTFGVPGNTGLFARAAGQDLASVDLPDAPSAVPNIGRMTYGLRFPASSHPETLSVSVLAMRDSSLPQPMEVTVNVQASEPRMRLLAASFVSGAMGAFHLSKSDFDDGGSTRVRLGITDVARTSATRRFQTSNHTLIVGHGYVEGDGTRGLGSIRLHINGSSEKFTFSAGGLDHSEFIQPLIAREYGDSWKLDVDYIGEGYLFLVYADAPVKATKS